MSDVTINGTTVTRAHLQIPAWGVWWLDAELDREITITGAATIAFADLTLTGTVLSGGPFRGSSRYRIAGGAGRWGRELPRKSYINDAGVRLATVLKDAAAEAGEQIDAASIPVQSLGSHYVREAGPASLLLQQHAMRNWYVGEDGITRIGQRATAAYTGTGTRTMVDAAHGRVDIAADEIAKLLPGITVDGVTAIDVAHDYADRKLRTTIWGIAGGLGARLDLERRKLRQLLPDLHYRGVYEYRVVSQQGERLNLQCASARVGLPDLRLVRVRPPFGYRANVHLGSLVLVTFVNADPARPCVIAGDDPSSPGFAPLRVDMVGVDDTTTAADMAKRVVRYGDVIMMPLGSAGTPTPTVVAANPLAPSVVSRVRA